MFFKKLFFMFTFFLLSVQPIIPTPQFCCFRFMPEHFLTTESLQPKKKKNEYSDFPHLSHYTCLPIN